MSPPPPVNEVRGHGVFLSSTVPRWSGQQHMLGRVPVQLGACRFPSIPACNAPFDYLSTVWPCSTPSCNTAVCVSACHTELDFQ